MGIPQKREGHPPLGVSEAEEEEVEEAPLARMSSKRAASIGLEDVSPMLSPTSGVRMDTGSRSEDLPEAAGGVEVHSDTIPSSGVLPSITPLVMEAPLEELCTAGAVVIGDSGISALDLANEPTIPAVDVAGSLRSFPFLQARLTRSLSHCVSLVAALDAAELKHDEELESSRLKLRKLEGDLESQRKLVEELRTVARGTHLQMQTYEARTVDGLEQGRLDFELSLSREKAELLQRLSDSRASSSKREEALRAELVGLRRAMREAADSFAAEKRSLEEARTGLTLRVAELSAVPAFPGDPAVLARRCIGVAMAVLEVAYLREGSRFQVRKEGRGRLSGTGNLRTECDWEPRFSEVVLRILGTLVRVLDWEPRFSEVVLTSGDWEP
ncbi:hypothetical protein CJ030_MR1G002655 [Morella rubra]|uniref:Uncharacterized protein n=1 Tax=Morella rubra TaxID=262757 RepID=A0A6A1WNM0_9ROSI|nr:hypothetical protein CJ030_MR1G002655 [Morella rubra]